MSSLIHVDISLHTDLRYSFWSCIVIFICGVFVYFQIHKACYQIFISGTYGIPKPWYFPVTIEYWFGQKSNGSNCGVKRLFRKRGKTKYSRLNQLDDDPLILNTGTWLTGCLDQFKWCLVTKVETMRFVLSWEVTIRFTYCFTRFRSSRLT